jgi:hypothetical protein
MNTAILIILSVTLLLLVRPPVTQYKLYRITKAELSLPFFIQGLCKVATGLFLILFAATHRDIHFLFASIAYLVVAVISFNIYRKR